MRTFIQMMFFAVPLLSFSQSATIRKVELAGDRIIVTYDLDDSNSQNEYLINLYASKDGFQSPLAKVSGDVGDEIAPGAGKRVEWNVREEYGNFKGKIALEIRGKVHVPFVKLQNFDVRRTYKRGKPYNIFWESGSSNPVHVELFKGSLRIVGDLNQPNSGSYTINIPPNAKKGNDYRLKISDSRNREEFIYTDYFRVSSRVPGILKIVVGAAAVGGGVFVATAGESNGSSGPVAIPLPAFPGN